MLYRSLPTTVPAPVLPLLLKRRRNGMMWGEEIACRLAESSVTRRFACVLATLNLPHSAVQRSTPSSPLARASSEPDACTQSMRSTILPCIVTLAGSVRRTCAPGAPITSNERTIVQARASWRSRV